MLTNYFGLLHSFSVLPAYLLRLKVPLTAEAMPGNRRKSAEGRF
jgi:hypothetical protein